MATSILDIEIRDEAFTKLKSSFDAYNAQVEKQPEAWVKIGSQAKEIATAILLANQAMEKSNDNIEKTAKGFKEVNRLSIAGKRAFSDLVDDSKKLADNVTSISKQMLGWVGIGGIFSGLLGAGGLFGIDRYAHQIAAGTKGAQGLGIPLGDQRSFRLNYERYVEPDSLLGKVADAQTDYTKMQWFRSLGIQGDVRKMDTEELAMQVYRNSRNLYANSDKSQQFIQSRGIDNFLSMEELRRSTRFSDRDIEASERQTRQDNKTFAPDPGTEDSWRRLSTALDKAEMKINTVLINGLAPLADPLAKISDHFSDLLATLLKSPVIKKWMEEFATGLEHLDKWISSDSFKSDVEGFATNIGKLALVTENVVEWLMKKLGIWTDPNAKPDVTPGDDPTKKGTMPYYAQHPDEAPMTESDRRRKAMGWRYNGTDQNGRIPGEPGYQSPDQQRNHADVEEWKKAQVFTTPAITQQLEQQYATKNGVPWQFAARIYQKEAGINPDGTPRISSAGAIGPGQLMPGTAADLGVNPFNTEQNVDGSTRYMAKMLKMFNGDQEKAAAAYNWGPGNVQSDIAAHGAAWRDFLPRETGKYIQGFSAGDGPIPGPAVSADPTYEKTMQRLREHNQTPPELSKEDIKAHLKRAIDHSPIVDRDAPTSAMPSPSNANQASIEKRGAGGSTYHITVANNTGGNAIITAGALAS